MCRRCKILEQEVSEAKDRAHDLWKETVEKDNTIASLTRQLHAALHKDEYEQSVSCSNCGHTFKLWLPKVHTLDEVKPVCERCGCATLSKMIEKVAKDALKRNADSLNNLFTGLGYQMPQWSKLWSD